MKFTRVLIFLLVLLPSALRANFSESPKQLATVNVYVDCKRCDFDYIRSEITFVNYVFDPKNADVYVLIGRQHTGSGGRKYTISFIGQRSFEGQSNTLTFDTQWDDTEETIRRKLVKTLKLGLIPFVSKTTIAGQINISFAKKKKKLQQTRDKWNYWVFRTQVSGDLGGEQSRSDQSLYLRFSAQRITPDWKIYSVVRSRYRKRNYKVEGSTISSINSNKSFYGMVVKSISDHWSGGIFVNSSSCTYSNIKIAYGGAPAVEYNIFPYYEAVRKQFRLVYRIGYGYRFYEEKTIYGKMQEGLLQETLHLALEVKQPWGTIESDVWGSNYLHDFSKNHLRVSGELSFRLIKGFAFDIRGSFSMIHDQLSLPQREATPEEILLRRRQLETQYSYNFSVGIEYTFGSIYNNIVNPRFGD